MKHLHIVLMSALLALSPVCGAWGMDVSVSGEWAFGGGYAKNTGTSFYSKKHGGEPEDPFSFSQRLRTQFEFISSENLKAVLNLQIGPTVWGSNGESGNTGPDAGGALDGDGVNIATRRAFLQWQVQNTPLTLQFGLQGLALPSATFGNPVLDTDVMGIVGSYQFNDTVTATLFWARPFKRTYPTETNRRYDEMDIFGLSAPIKLEDATINPWGVVSAIGGDSGYFQYRFGADSNDETLDFNGTSFGWWLGSTFELEMFKPVTFKLDAMYGSLSGSHLPRDNSGPFGESPEYKGWHISALLEYESETMWGNPGLLGWHASGDGRHAGRDASFGRMPVLSVYEAGYAPTSLGFPGSNTHLTDSVIGSSGVGTWGVGLQSADITFLDDLTHTLRVAWIGGTNHPDNVRNGFIGRDGGAMGDDVYLTTKDYAVEVDLFSTYKVSDNLNVHLETGYMHLHRDNEVWSEEDADTDAVWKAQILLQYTF